jgi:hypothetical protein
MENDTTLFIVFAGIEVERLTFLQHHRWESMQAFADFLHGTARSANSFLN